MKKGITFLLTILWVLNLHAQEFGTHWVSYPFPNDSSEVWFRKSYTLRQAPLQAYISMASTGNLRLYINERNVSRSIFYEGVKKNTLQLRTFDITRFLKKGKNVIAVWYAPQPGQEKSKQLSLEFYGWDRDTIAFYHKADGSWWSKQLRKCSMQEKEHFDANEYFTEWKSEDYETPEKSHTGWIQSGGIYHSTWQHPTGTYSHIPREAIAAYQPLRIENKLAHVHAPIHTYSDSLGYHIDFQRPFRGTLRLTIRDARKGALLNIQGNQYVCCGEMDEQAFFRFHCETHQTYTLQWGQRFKKSNITHIEGLEISE